MTPTAPLRCTVRGTQYTIQNLAAWDAHLNGLVSPEGLKKARIMLIRGWEGMASDVPFLPGTDEAKSAWQALNFRAHKMGYRYDKIFQRYAPL